MRISLVLEILDNLKKFSSIAFLFKITTKLSKVFFANGVCILKFVKDF